MFDGIEFNSMMFIGPLIILAITMFLVALIYKLLFSWMPRSIFNFFLGPITLFVGGYLWVYPMNMGFYELFK